MRSNAASLMNWGTTRNWNGSRTSGVALNKSRSKLTDIIALLIDDEPWIVPWVRVGYSSTIWNSQSHSANLPAACSEPSGHAQMLRITIELAIQSRVDHGTCRGRALQ